MSFSLRVALNDDIMMNFMMHHLIHDDTLLIYHYYINHNHRAVYVGGESTLNAGFSTFFGNTARSAGGAVSKVCFPFYVLMSRACLDKWVTSTFFASFSTVLVVHSVCVWLCVAVCVFKLRRLR